MLRSLLKSSALFAVLVTFSPVLMAQVEISDEERVALHLSVYNSGLGVITDERRLVLPRGEVTLALQDITMNINPRTAAVTSAESRGFVAREQNYRFDLLNRHSLLVRFIGRKLKYSRFIRQEEGYEKILREGVLLSIEPEIVRFGDVIEIEPEGTISLPYLPKDLITEPTLFVSGKNNLSGQQDITLRYHSDGLGWEADYELFLDDPSTLGGWVSVSNHSGMDIDASSLRLVAGDVNTMSNKMAPIARMSAMAESVGGAVQENAGDYHAYTYPAGAMLGNNQTSRLQLMKSSLVNVRKQFRLVSGVQRYAAPQAMRVSPTIRLSFDNSADNGLGNPLPMGTVRVYERGSRQGGTAEVFLGEAHIGHTPIGTTVDLDIGQAFDVLVERTQTTYRQLGERSMEVAYRLHVTNGGNRAADVVLHEQLFGDWDIVSQSKTGSKVDAMTYQFNMQVPAHDAVDVTYTARIRW